MGNYYEILGVSETATQEQIKNAYRSLVKKYHPDINPDPNAVNMMQNINIAYEVLSNLSSRRKYDEQLRKNSKVSTQSTSNSRQYGHYSSYSKTREESERDFDEWLKEYLKKQRQNNKTYYSEQIKNDYNTSDELINIIFKNIINNKINDKQYNNNNLNVIKKIKKFK